MTSLVKFKSATASQFEYNRMPINARLAAESIAIEAQHGRNAYSSYINLHNERPDANIARTMGLALGCRLLASDGQMYPKLTLSEKERLTHHNEQKRRRKEMAAKRDALIAAIQLLASIKFDTEPQICLADGDRTKFELDRQLDQAIESLHRFASCFEGIQNDLPNRFARTGRSDSR